MSKQLNDYYVHMEEVRKDISITYSRDYTYLNFVNANMNF